MTTATIAPDAAVRAVRSARRTVHRRHRLVILGLALAVVAVFGARVLLGDYHVTVPDFLRILTGEEIPGATYIVMETKLPRAVLGVLTGIAFGVAGAIFQTTLRNPLASPDVIGVSIGASAAVVFALVTLDLTGRAVSVAAVVGAVGVALLVRVLAGSDGGTRLVLIGIGLAAALQAVIQYLFTRANVYDAQLALRWMTGSLNQVDWPTVRLLTAAMAVLLPLVWWQRDTLRTTELGDDAARALGLGRTATDRLLLLAVALTAVGVAAAGPIAFVAFAAGPIARSLNGGRTTLVGAALTGAVIVVGADYVADYLVFDANLPVGVVTGAFGAPLLLWLMARGPTRRTA